MTAPLTTSLPPIYLRCEYLVNPLGIDSPSPRLSWILPTVPTAPHGQKQVAYQILVASTQALLATDSGDLWDSGKCLTSQSAHIEYKGGMLSSGMRCWWKVRVWERRDIPSAYSGVAFWEMGLLSPDDWQAQWIGLDLSTLTEQRESDAYTHLPGLKPSPYFRKTLSLSHPARRARLYITAKGVYEAHINGHRVGDARLTPGWTNYNTRIQYQTYDVTMMMQQGDNVVGALLGTGWYSGHIGFPAAGGGYDHYGSEPQLLFQLHLDCTDGTSVVLLSDETWQGTTGPIFYSDLLMGERYDARRELIGWDQAGSTDTSWSAVSRSERDAVLLVADQAQPILVTETIRPQMASERTPGCYVFDMGQNMVGWVRLHVQGEAGTLVQMRFAEMLDADGTLYTENLRTAKQTDTYILKGEAPEVFEPHFTFHGFRYVEVTGYPGTPTIDTLTGCVVHSATPQTGTFECSSAMVNQLHRNILWGQRGNFLSVPTDCPQRDERLGWMGDAQIFVHTASYNMDVAAFFTKWMNDVGDAQSPEGAFPDTAPRMMVVVDGAPAWGDAGIIVPWTIYQMYGDTRILEQHYDAMVRWIHYLQHANPHLLWTHKLNNNYGDWLSIDADTPKEVLATAYFAYDVLLLSKIASVLRRHDDAETYRVLFQGIQAAFCHAYVTLDGRIVGETQTCYVLALHMDLLPSELRPLAAKHLVEDIEKKGWHLSTGFVGVGYLCPVLSEMGYTDVAYRLLMSETFPSWGYSIKHGATTIWERWDGWTEEHGFQDAGMNSFNHYSLGSVGQWLYQYVAGIERDNERPGYQHSIIRPYSGGELTYAKAEYASMYGLIKTHWQRDVNRFTLRVTLPANTTATVYLPTSRGNQIVESGKRVEEAEGIVHVQEENAWTLFEIGSGEYEFVCVQ